MLLVAKLSDVVTDPLVGTISDRLRSPIAADVRLFYLVCRFCADPFGCFLCRWRARIRFICYWPLPVCISAPLWLACLMALGELSCRPIIINAPVTAWREQFTLIGLLVAAFIPFLVEQYGEGDTPSIMRGMALAICITTPIAVILLCLFVPETPPSESSDEAKAFHGWGKKYGQ